MTDLTNMSHAARSAAMRQGHTSGWGRHGSSAKHVRYIEPVQSLRKCHCGCAGRVTHAGRANGVTLISGCELRVRRWVRDGR